ncbi:MAG: hypothetical protein ACFFD4_08000 [Candidatus Odinarchaeota archaeon]
MDVHKMALRAAGKVMQRYPDYDFTSDDLKDAILSAYLEVLTEDPSESDKILIYQDLMKLQLRIASLEHHAEKKTSYQAYDLITPEGTDGNHLVCPKCKNWPMKTGSSTDEHDTYLWVQCTNPDCKFSYSPSHD